MKVSAERETALGGSRDSDPCIESFLHASDFWPTWYGPYFFQIKRH